MSECAVDGCQNESRRRGWCGKHYLRWYRHGDPEALLPTYERCRVDGCERRPRSTRKDLCEMHYYRLRRHGDPIAVVDVRQPDAKYRAAHARIVSDRGPASAHRCVDCEQCAQQWSYAHTDKDELHSPGGQPYSLDSRHYEPRCVACHIVFDRRHGQPHR